MIKLTTLSLFLTVLVGCTYNTPEPTTAENEQKLDVGFSRYVKTQQEALEASVKVEFGRVTGSGFVINTYLDETQNVRGYEIVTAAHVLKEEFYDPTFPIPLVRFTKRGVPMTYQAEIVWRDTEVDVAILRAWGQTPYQICFPFEVIGNDDYLQYSKDVYMVSFPQGYGPMLTEGIISGISILDWDRAAYTTTAQSAPGSSGGPIVDSSTGQVLGFLKAVVTVPGTPQFLGWQSIVGPASDLRKVIALNNGNNIIPAGPRGEKTIIIFTPTQR